MRLLKANKQHAAQLIQWIDDEQDSVKACKTWAGTGVIYPLNKITIVDDMRFAELNAHALIDEQQHLVAFGQYYERLGRCHLARLLVNPDYRGQGIIATLMQKLIQKAHTQLHTDGVSLFVYADNASAMRAYQKFGFVTTDYPDSSMQDIGKDDFYMVKLNNEW